MTHKLLHEPIIKKVDTGHTGAQVYTAGGRRLLPPVQLGGRPAFLAAADPWRLLAVAAGGALWVWDLAALRVEVQGSAAPLLALGPARGGCPLSISI
jgi:TUP1-like enhancer of split